MLVFTRTKHRAEKLSRQIAVAGFRATSLHSDRSQGQRQSALAGFKSGHFQVMVATDIAARGLDVEGISHVINFDMPATADDYIHRIGRTGRAEHTGDAFTLVTPDDKDMVRALEKIMGKPLPHQTLEGFNYTAPAPDRPAYDPRRAAPHSDCFHSQGKTHQPANAAFLPNRSLRQKFAGGRTK